LPIDDFKSRSLDVEIDISSIQLGAHKALQQDVATFACPKIRAKCLGKASMLRQQNYEMSYHCNQTVRFDGRPNDCIDRSSTAFAKMGISSLTEHVPRFFLRFPQPVRREIVRRRFSFHLSCVRLHPLDSS
jgi:hypothetical protein